MPTATARLGTGDVLIAFSDGAFERRDEDFDAGYDRLVARLRSAPLEPADQCIAAISVTVTRALGSVRRAGMSQG